MRILIVEDDKYIAEALAETLTEQLFVVDVATDGLAGWQQAQIFDYDLILLDVMLPKLDGITLCRQLRNSKKNSLILLLTARDCSQDKVKGLDAGADDYVVKPFDMEELFARIRALLRRGNKSASLIKEWGDLCLNPNTCEVSYSSKQLNLTPKEYGMLNLFMHNNQRVFSCSAILDKLWNLEDIPTEDTVRAHIKGLRQKLKAVGAPTDLIETIYGLGYRLKQEDQNSSAKKSKKHNKNKPKESDSTKQKLHHSIARIWERFQGSIGERINVLEQAARAGKNCKLDRYLQQQAQQEAHKLAGSMGTFGFGYASELAKEIEILLTAEIPLNSEQVLHLCNLVIRLRSEVDLDNITANKQEKNQQIQSINIPLASDLVSPGQTDNFSQECQLLVILEKDSLLEQQLVKEAEIKNVQCIIAKNSTLLTNIATNINENLYFNGEDFSLSPNIVLVDLDIISNPEKILTKCASQIPFLPVVVLNTKGDLSERIKIAKLGAAAYLQKPLPPDRVIDVVLDVWRQNYTPATVMIVNNDNQILETLKDLLKQWGIKTFTLNDERNLWETLENTVPDLLILDTEMSHFNGIDLCQVIRNDPNWSWLPIVFLVAHNNNELHHQVFAAGADDYISKPFRDSELVIRILNRIKRSLNIRFFGQGVKKNGQR
ncbi:MAG: response regulator [Microcoleaceae cyanobacterium]